MKKTKSLINNNRFVTSLIVIIIIVVILRIALVLFSPPGFFLDEAATGAHVVAMLHQGTNAHGIPWPLFSESLGGGYTTPIYLYPLVGWAAIFGTSELALRYFSVIFTLLAIGLMAAAMNKWFGRREALITAAAMLALPWGWLQGSLAWDPALVPFFVGLAFLSFTLLYHSSKSFDRTLAYGLFPLSLIGLAYLYPPLRVTAPLLFIAGYAVLLRHKQIDLRTIAVTCLIAAIVSLPLLQFMLQPAALGRTSALSVFHDTSVFGGLWLVIVNMLGLINPFFLFVNGDPNLRHATGIQGMLGAAAIIPLVVLATRCIRAAWKRQITKVFDPTTILLISIGIFGIIASLLGSALTNESQPHSLRATAAWPFAIILIVIGWRIILAHRSKLLRYSAIAVFVVATIGYAVDLAFFYPTRAAGSFDVPQREAIYHHQSTPGYPDMARQYYETR